jgi:hypothetical protein
MNLLPKILPRSDEERQSEIERRLINSESKIGGRLFGSVPRGHKRQFFCLDEYTWIWYEEWKDQNGRRRFVTTRYEIRSNGIIKVQDGQPAQILSGAEVDNFYQASLKYYELISDSYRQMLAAY